MDPEQFDSPFQSFYDRAATIRRMRKTKMESDQTAAFAEALDKISEAIKATKKTRSSRETSLAITKLEEAAFWLHDSRTRAAAESYLENA